jgi:hypothetical protein
MRPFVYFLVPRSGVKSPQPIASSRKEYPRISLTGLLSSPYLILPCCHAHFDAKLSTLPRYGRHMVLEEMLLVTPVIPSVFLSEFSPYKPL